MTDQITLESAVSGMESSMTSQFEGIQKLFINNLNIVKEALNYDNDAYNELVDQCEKLQTERNTLELKLNSLKDSHKEEKQNLEIQLTEKTRLLTAASIKLGTFNELKEELKKLKALNPERIKERLNDAKKRNQDLLKDNQTLRSNYKKYRSENIDLRKLNAELEATAQEVHNQYSHMADLLNHDDGETVKKEFVGKNGLKAYINVFSYPMPFKASNGEIANINDFDFHLEVKTNYAINLNINCSTYGIPFLPDCKDLQGIMPESLNAALQSIYLDRMSGKHDYLLDRIEALQDVGIHEIPGMTEKLTKLLNDSDYYSVFSVVHTPKTMFIRNVKGLGAKSGQEVLDLCNAYVRQWEKDNWTEEQIKKYGTK